MSILWYSKKHVSETICFHPQVKGWETPILLGSLQKADLSHWTAYVNVNTHLRSGLVNRR
jgi:hypothetical protein